MTRIPIASPLRNLSVLSIMLASAALMLTPAPAAACDRTCGPDVARDINDCCIPRTPSKVGGQGRAEAKADGTAGGKCFGNDTCFAGLACKGGVCGLQNQGDAGGACYPNATCNAGLDCKKGICQASGKTAKPGAPSSPERFPVVVNARDPVKGPAGAPVTIIEFADFESKFGAKAVPVLESLRAKYGSKLRIVFKQHPLAFMPNDQFAAEASLAANEQGADKFWALHDAMFKISDKLSRARILALAKNIGLNMPQFAAAIESGKFKNDILADIAQARRFGTTGTPVFYVNGRKIIGAQPREVFEKVIDEELMRARHTPSR